MSQTGIVFAAVCGVTLCLLVGIVPILMYGIPASIQEFGDAFGFMNAFVSACAFTVLIVTMLWQREELTLQRQELQRSAKRKRKRNNHLLKK